ncbi:hypothetical protein [Paenibacillus maysiensis]|uniref:hypothetical protein n=1 Tax=Paenibacillus maysiensis TaxID=1155954 RepID=UPI00046EEA21|nr:hypothetical protein [Paenibacillus maysiensis]
MNIIKEIPSEIEETIQQLHESGMPPADRFYSGGTRRSHIYKIEKYCLKLYTPEGYNDFEDEVEVILALQGKCAPEMYAYSSRRFILTEWIEGLNLEQYKEKHGHHPPNLIYDWYRTEMEIQNVGFTDSDFKLQDNLLWLPSGDVKRLDFGVCIPIVDSIIEMHEKQLRSKIQEMYDGELKGIKNELRMKGFKKNEADQAISNFLAHSPKLI